MKFLLGGVPLGCDNIGDEAIIACVVRLIRTLVPGAEMTVCTRDRENTARLLAVQTAPLYGFPPDPRLDEFQAFVSGFDAFIWFGATGLSDYPGTALPLLARAQDAGVKTIVWCVGMDDELNPAFFQVRGKRKKLLEALTWLSLGTFDAVAYQEARLRAQARQSIFKTLAKCQLVTVRDPESARELGKCGLDNIIVAADTAILQETATALPLPEIPGVKRCGFCISAQRELKQKDELLELWARLLERPDTRLVLIPMNPKTDRELMGGLAAEVPQQDRIEILDSSDPATVQACASQCRVVVSSRLHLLILASNVHVPVIGIERGSKIRNWLANFHDVPAGTVYNCDFHLLYKRILGFLETSAEHDAANIAPVMAALYHRLNEAADYLKATLLE
ncbi:MAG: polysaccharide pyruvyl transferase family protein [Victivallales bacterium]|nr:polysaccharide pyruvyl transferase family protein [Victivallales bacterium]